jgi:deoxyribonuclease-4
MKKLWLGHHISIANGFVETIDYALESKSNVYQIFFNSPRSTKTKLRSDEELNKLSDELTKNNIKIVIHGSYLINFCRSKETSIYKNSIKLLVDDLNQSVKINALGVIIHMGRNTENLDNVDAISNYVRGIKKVLDKSDSRSILILETGTGTGKEICGKISELGNIVKLLTENERKRVKYCLDTCHMFAMGYDLSSSSFISKFERSVQKHLKWENVVSVHLNDSRKQLGSNVDGHADIGKGYIGKKGLTKFIKICYDKNIPLILETPTNSYDGKQFTYKDQVRTVKKWIGYK